MLPFPLGRTGSSTAAPINHHRLIWARLDQVHARHPDMQQRRGGSPKGAKLIASRWADHR
jgi:hypothetical protein